jgi:hypothetical protein
MTQLLEQAISQVQNLPDTAQDSIAAIILDELADERRWQAAFAQSTAHLTKLADKVRDDIRAGRVTTGGFDQL